MVGEPGVCDACCWQGGGRDRDRVSGLLQGSHHLLSLCSTTHLRSNSILIPPPTTLSSLPGPQVIDQQTGVVFSGESPTKPWTDVCLAHKTGQRISGPLFFGFSELANQRAIAGLYAPEELQAALQVRHCGGCLLGGE